MTVERISNGHTLRNGARMTVPLASVNDRTNTIRCGGTISRKIHLAHISPRSLDFMP
ncbi:hypothetical protein D3C83_271730 [compost metagenome]